MNKNLRVVISCVAFETVKIVDPIKFYKADKAYLLHTAERDIYKRFLDEVTKRIKKLNIECVPIRTTIYEFSLVLKELLEIMRKEKDEGNHVYVNVEAGPQVYGAAAMVACMMEGATPFFVANKRFQVEEKAYFDDGVPVGLSAEVHDPKEVPTFKLKPPNRNEVKALKIWNEKASKGHSMTDNSIIESLEREGLIKDIYDEGGRKISYKAKMGYRRKFLDRWITNKWVQRTDRGKYEITEFGKVAVEVFKE